MVAQTVGTGSTAIVVEMKGFRVCGQKVRLAGSADVLEV